MKTIGFVILSLLFLEPAFAGKVFERFDGQFYNGLYYPMIDIIEWGEQNKELPHIEFHLHSKDKPIDVSVVPGEKGGKPVLWIMYDLKFRGEKVCRHVLAPRQFKEGMKLYTYRDNSDSDYDNVYVYSEPMKQPKGKKPIPEYTMPPYERCLDENASNMPYGKGETPKPVETKPNTPSPTGESNPAVAPRASSEAAPPVKSAPEKLPIDYGNASVPFSF